MVVQWPQNGRETTEEDPQFCLSSLLTGSRPPFEGLFDGKAIQTRYIVSNEHKIARRFLLTFLRGRPLPLPLVGGARISPSGPLECFCLICV